MDIIYQSQAMNESDAIWVVSYGRVAGLKKPKPQNRGKAGEMAR
jgi:hypothetical protein